MSINLLALDTSSESCSVALMHHGHVTEKTVLSTSKEHTKILIPVLQAVLAEAKFTLNELNGLVIAAGPAASFTGLRLSASLAQGIAFSLNLPIIHISTLEALAKQWLSSAPSSKPKTLGIVIDAKMQSFYFASYAVGSSKNIVQPKTYEMIATSDLLQNTLEQAGCDVVLSELPVKLKAQTKVILGRQHLAARHLLALASQKLKTQPLSSFKAENALPNYLRTKEFWAQTN